MQTGHVIDLDGEAKAKTPKSLEDLELRGRNEFITQTEYKIAGLFVDEKEGLLRAKYLHEVLIPEGEKEAKAKDEKIESLKAEIITLDATKERADRDKAKELKKEKETLEQELNKLRSDIETSKENISKLQEAAANARRQAEYFLKHISA